MPKKRKRKGYNKRSHSEHPGVSLQVRHGVVVLRYDMPNTLTKCGRPMQKQVVVGDPVTKECVIRHMIARFARLIHGVNLRLLTAYVAEFDGCRALDGAIVAEPEVHWEAPACRRILAVRCSPG